MNESKRKKVLELESEKAQIIKFFEGLKDGDTISVENGTNQFSSDQLCVENHNPIYSLIITTIKNRLEYVEKELEDL